MRNLFLILLLIVLVVIQKANAQTPVAWYPFNGNANDVAGTNHGTVNGATLTTDRLGNPNSAYSFDGVNDKITAPLPTTVTNNYTLTGWVKVNSIGADQLLFYNGNSSLNGYGLYLSNTGTLYVIHGLINLYSTGFSLTANQWIFLSLVHQSGTTKVYVNASEVFNSSTGSPNTPTDLFYMSSNTFGTEYFNGSLDEIKIFNTALTASQVQEVYNPVNYSGQFSNSVNMDGVNDYIQPPAVLNGATQFTIEYWIKTVESRSNGTFSQNPTMIGNEVPGASSGEFSIYSSNGFIGMWGELNSGTQNFVSSSTRINDNRWHHIAAVNNGTDVILYVDGNSVGSIPSGNGIVTSGQPLRIGANHPASISLVPHQGYFDEVRFWNIARTQSELIAAMNTPLTGTETGLQGYWDMNRNGQGAGLTVDNKCVATGAAFNGITVGTGTTPVFEQGTTQLKPGSGNAISFDGVDDVISVPNAASLQFPGDLSVECWVKIPAAQNNTTAPVNSIIEKWEGSNAAIGYPFALRLNRVSHSVDFLRYNGTSSAGVSGTSVIDDNKWHHIVATRSGSTLSIYIDGVLQATDADLADLTNANNVQRLNIGSRGVTALGPCNLTGTIDEVRIWNSALTSSQIRDRMCRKLTVADPLYTNLVAYYNFDETSSATTFDGTSNANDGTLTNNPTRVTSGAAIGDASSHDYVNSTKTASIAHPSGENFTITSTSGNPDGIHLYRVDEKPNTLAGAVGVGGNNKYFGVFQVNGTSPVYTAVYNYDGNPFVGTLNEAQVRLQKRNDNATMVWSPLSNTPDVVANTITVTGESTEYILGKQGDPLPLKLISFTGTKQNSNALLQWTTSNEVDLSHFDIQRSDNGLVFTTIGTLRAGGNTYSFPDINVFVSKANVFYRLKSVDTDGQFTYTNIIKLSQQPSGLLSIYPNPVKEVLTISGLKQSGTIQFYGTDGKLLKQLNVSAQVMTIDLRAYAKGIYLLNYRAEGETRTQQIIKH